MGQISPINHVASRNTPERVQHNLACLSVDKGCCPNCCHSCYTCCKPGFNCCLKFCSGCKVCDECPACYYLDFCHCEWKKPCCCICVEGGDEGGDEEGDERGAADASDVRVVVDSYPNPKDDNVYVEKT